MLIFAIIFVFMVLLGGLALSSEILGNVFTFRKSGWRRTDFIFDRQKSISVQYDRCCQSGI